MSTLDQYIHQIEEELSQKKSRVKAAEVGTVLQVKDGIALLEGLENAAFGEIVRFENGVEGMVIDMSEGQVGVIVLGDYLKIKAGEVAKATGKTLSMPVSDDLLGRVVNPLGVAVDGGEQITAEAQFPIEKVAPGVVARKSVTVPVQTGIIAIDALTAVGRGQRELIIGDREQACHPQQVQVRTWL
jgi:F-type H+-transporting ATPase subunit alpha